MLEANHNTFEAVKISALHTLALYPRNEVLKWLEPKPAYMKKALSKIIKLG